MDTNAAASIANAHAAGIKNVDVYFFPCSYGKSVQSQVDLFYKDLNNP